MKTSPWLPVLAIVIAFAVGFVVWQSQNTPDKVDGTTVVKPGANAPTENNDLEALRHIKEMAAQEAR